MSKATPRSHSGSSSSGKKMPDRNIIGNWTTLRHAVGRLLGPGERGDDVAEGDERQRAEHDEDGDRQGPADDGRRSRTRHADADDDDRLDGRDEQPHDDVAADQRAPRGSGVAASRLRISFSRCATSGMAAKMPSCMSAMARMLGTK